MEIFRHYYTAAELNTVNFFNQHMNNFGFCNLDGSKIDFNWTYNSSINMRYKLDAKKQSYLNFSTASNYYYGQHWNRALTDLQFHASNETTYGVIKSSSGGYGMAPCTVPATIVFLPLKNNGFLLNVRSINISEGRNTSSDLTESNDSRDFTFCCSTPTPSLNTKIYGTNATSANTPSTVMNFIGVPPCKFNQNWTYILYVDSAYSTNYNRRYQYIIDFGNGKVFDLPFKSNFIRDYHLSTPAYTEPTYSNINENICSMIKLPYDSGYIDGVYLLTTAPQQLQDATFFSFDGRNFLNAFDNYVFELPPSTT